MLPCLLSAMSVMPLVTKLLTVLSVSKAEKDVPSERAVVKAEEAEVLLVLRAVKDLVEKVVVAVVTVIKAVKEIILFLIITHVLVIFVMIQDILQRIARMRRNLRVL